MAMADEGRDIRVVAADDHYLARVALASVLGTAEGVRLVAVCGGRDERWRPSTSTGPM